MIRLTIAVTLVCLQVASLQAESLADSQICTEDGSYKRYYPDDCDKYYECDQGKATEKSCGWFHKFDEESHSCVFHVGFIGSVDCSKALTPNPTATAATNAPTTATSTTQPPKSSTTNKAGTGTSAATTPNSVSTTKKHNGAGSIEISMILATLCTLGTVFRHLH